jgi:hypothetical protein
MEVAGVSMPDSAVVSDESLLLNGMGVRYRAVFRVYVAGLYLPKKAQDPKEVLNMRGAKRLHAVMLRDVEGDTLGRLLMQGIRDNASKEETQRHSTSIFKLGQAFATRKKLSTKESFSINFDVQKGPQIFLNNKPLGDPLNDPAFNSVFLKVWLGDRPADEFLKRGLLGLSEQAN